MISERTYSPSKRRKYTYNDYLRTPEDKRYELLNENLTMLPSPYTKHQIISREIFWQLMQFIKSKSTGELFEAPMDVYFDSANCVQPDIFFIYSERKNIITEKNIHGAPDLIVEIISAGSIHRDLVEKKALYEKFGVKEYWIVFPDEEIIEIYLLNNGNKYELYQTAENGEEISSAVLKDLKVAIKDIFAP